MAGRFSPRLDLRASYRIDEQMITEPKSVICLHERHNFDLDSVSNVVVNVDQEDDFEVAAVSNDDCEVGSVFEVDVVVSSSL